VKSAALPLINNNQLLLLVFCSILIVLVYKLQQYLVLVKFLQWRGNRMLNVVKYYAVLRYKVTTHEMRSAFLCRY